MEKLILFVCTAFASCFVLTAGASAESGTPDGGWDVAEPSPYDGGIDVGPPGPYDGGANVPDDAGGDAGILVPCNSVQLPGEDSGIPCTDDSGVASQPDAFVAMDAGVSQPPAPVVVEACSASGNVPGSLVSVLAAVAGLAFRRRR